jgi:hypothetical protein
MAVTECAKPGGKLEANVFSLQEKADRAGSRDHMWLRTVALFALEDQADRLLLRPDDTNDHGAIRGQAVSFSGNCAGLRGDYLQDLMIPTGLALEIFASVNGGIVLAVADVVVKEGLGGAFIHETAGDDDDAVPICDGNSAGLNNGLAGEVALGGHQRPGAIQGAMVSRERGECAEERRDDGSGNSSV